MTYISLGYYLMLAVLAAVYYLVPRRIRWVVLLAGSAFFYGQLHMESAAILVFGASILCCYLWGLVLEKHRQKKGERWLLGAAIVTSALPLLLSKGGTLLANSVLHRMPFRWIVPVGLAFYSMQMIAYLADIAKGKIQPQRNLFKFTLFISFFPQIIQGPISRYDQLAPQLFEGNRFDEKKILRGLQLILWGFFLKLMIADKAAIFVDAVFADFWKYSGVYLWAAAILYSIQLYADFLSCVSLSRGAASLFGVELVKNFRQPYLATSVKAFWRRWHISLSTWLRDYIYIPLGGNRCGWFRKAFNVAVVFLVSGLWHGNSIQFIFWGLLHAGYQIAGEMTFGLRERLYTALGFSKDSAVKKAMKTVGTFVLVMLGWVIFRATSLRQGLEILQGMFAVQNWWVLSNDALFTLGLSAKEFFVLGLSIAVLFGAGCMEEKYSVGDKILAQPLPVRYALYLLVIAVIWIFGTYGIGFNAQDFIYGGF